MKRNKLSCLSSSLLARYPEAKCSLLFSSPYQCLVAVMLSAQCADEKVNRVTPLLFKRYPEPFSLSEADPSELEKIIRPLGLSRSKARHLKDAAARLAREHRGEVPSDYASLLSLPGVGNKTARVVLMECFKVPSFPVDTHVQRIAKRLGLAKENETPTQIEKRLERIFKKEEQTKLHHCFIAFGREICHAKNPECLRCFLQSACPYFAKKSSFKTGR